MGITVADYIDVRQRAKELGLPVTSHLAILPRGFGGSTPSQDLVHEADASTVRKLLKAAGIDVQQVEPLDGRFPSVIQRSAEWLAPTIFVGSMFITQNPYAVQVALNVLASYVSDLLKGRFPAPRVKVTIVVEQGKSKRCRRIDYEGPPSGLEAVADFLREVHDELR